MWQMQSGKSDSVQRKRILFRLPSPFGHLLQMPHRFQQIVQLRPRGKLRHIPAHAWYSGYAKYLNNNGVTYGKSKTIFAPDDAITRAEFTALAIRFFDVYGDGNKAIMEQYKDFGDVSDGYWAAEYIKAAAKSGWINGYEDGSFRADRNISRAEVVTIVNRLLGREADESYIADNLRKLNTFSDMSGKHQCNSLRHFPHNATRFVVGIRALKDLPGTDTVRLRPIGFYVGRSGRAPSPRRGRSTARR